MRADNSKPQLDHHHITIQPGTRNHHKRTPRMIPFPQKTYEIIYADPPWKYNTSGMKNPDRTCLPSSPNRYYKTLSQKELQEIPTESITKDNCLLFLWTTAPLLEEAISTAKAWGFKYSTIGFVWDKTDVNPGNYTLSQCEFCLIFKKGKIPQPRGARNIRQFLSKPRTKHSEKPFEIRNRIQEMFPTQSKIELFARTTHEHWDSWGNQIETEIPLLKERQK